MIAYKTARLYLDKPTSLLATMSMAVPYWYWNFYTEGKAEHFCMLWVAYLHALGCILYLSLAEDDLSSSTNLWICMEMGIGRSWLCCSFDDEMEYCLDDG